MEYSPPPVGHNYVKTLAGAAEANVESGVLLLCKEFLVTAIQDYRLNRTHLRVLACFVEYVNRRTGKAWPGRALIAETLGLSPMNVSNALHELRKWGYLIMERERVPEAGDRVLAVYTFGNVDHETIRREIDTYIAKLKGKPTDFTPQGEPTSPHRVNTTSPYGVNFTSEGEPTSPYGVDSNSNTTSVESISLKAPAKSEPTKRGTRLGEDWRLPKSWGEWALEHFHITRDQVVGEAARFKDYWIAAPGAKASKKDWPATWRNWIRGSPERPKYRPRKVDQSIAPDLAAAADPGAELDAMLERARNNAHR